MSETEKPSNEWYALYEAIKQKLRSATDLDDYFTQSKIADNDVALLDLGKISFPSGKVIVCDPLVELTDVKPFIQTIEPGSYPVLVCVVPSDKNGDRYACVKLALSNEKPVVYELAMTGLENLEEEIEDGEYFGFGVDAGMACIADLATQSSFAAFWDKRLEKDPDIDPYNDLFEEELEKNAKAHPKYQRDGGDWLNYTIPGTNNNVAIFASGWGDGYYPVYFGYDAKGKLCGIYIKFIDIAEEYAD